MEEAHVGRRVRAHIFRPKADEEEHCYKPHDAYAPLFLWVAQAALDDEEQEYCYI